MRASRIAAGSGAPGALRRREWVIVVSVAVTGLALAALAVLTPWSAAGLTGRSSTAGSVDDVVVETVPPGGRVLPARAAGPGRATDAL